MLTFLSYSHSTELWLCEQTKATTLHSGTDCGSTFTQEGVFKVTSVEF